MAGHDAALEKPSRTRTGCLNCRRKKRKCDERHPSCGACCKGNQPCEWGLRLSFRAENARHLDRGHPSMRTAARRRPRGYEILDITSEVIRDYHASLPPGLDGHTHLPRTRSATGPDSAPRSSGAMERPFDGVDPPLTTAADASPTARRQTENAVANLLYLSHGGQPREMPGSMSVEHMAQPQDFTSDGISTEDGVFLPGSVYREPLGRYQIASSIVFSQVRRRAGRPPGPEADNTIGEDDATMDDGPPETKDMTLASARPAPLSKEVECTLWRNWFNHIAPWLDMFDSERHFQYMLPTMAHDHDHLRYSMLALSARQMELKKHTTLPADYGLSLYQEAIHRLLPNIPSPSTAVVASYVILCVLEVLSCSPKAWKRHLEGCARLMETVGFAGLAGGLEQALFWCFARMDVCGGLVSSVAALIPASHWASASSMNLGDHVRALRPNKELTSWANYAVYLTVQVLDLLAPLSDTSDYVPNRADPEFRTRWLRLWKYISDWPESRPAPLCPVMTIPSSDSSPFPTIIFSNPAAVSGNQLYHTASLLMLQNHPHGVRLSPKPRSIFWHARRVCAISISTDHHGAWINGVQPLWIAGRCMSRPAEHKAIIELLERIETESGWGTQWQVDDLEAFWGTSSGLHVTGTEHTAHK
ncbi:Uncharacterized protein TCAP_02518 [Tolypocladium capitatum]|uniref:Zn(2)-C6 fungal-type domain-containing protein n=1 Tax=Tolypocladium capitatum TaxID=45235 RepID=A0A2K3QJ45_9HYPO|nr:Uncharacterized protein TCAP_02518 [Tolypocladium capitatum]